MIKWSICKRFLLLTLSGLSNRCDRLSINQRTSRLSQTHRGKKIFCISCIYCTFCIFWIICSFSYYAYYVFCAYFAYVKLCCIFLQILHFSQWQMNLAPDLILLLKYKQMIFGTFLLSTKLFKMKYFLFWFLKTTSSFFRRCNTKLNREIIFPLWTLRGNSQCVHDISESDLFDNFNLFSFNFLSVDVCEVSELWSFCIFFLLLLRLMNSIFFSLFDIFIDGSQKHNS